MKLSLLTAAILFSAGAQAHAISPCRAETLKALTCVLNNPAGSLKIEVTRSRSVDAGGGRCSRVGQVSESVSANLSVPAQGNFSDLYFSRERLASPLTDLEQGRPLSLELYSAGLTTEPEQASVQLLPENGVVKANLELRAKVGSIYSSPKFSRVEIAGTTTCF